MVPDSAAKVKQALDLYLAGIENGEAKDSGVNLAEDVALKVVALRAEDGTDKVNILSSRHPARRRCADHADGELGICRYAAMGDDQSFAVSSLRHRSP